MSSEIDRLAQIMREDSKETRIELAKMAESITGFTVSMTAIMERQEARDKAHEKEVEYNKEAFARIREENKDQEIRIRKIETAVGVGKVFDDINKGKIISYWPHALSVASLAFAIIMWVKG